MTRAVSGAAYAAQGDFGGLIRVVGTAQATISLPGVMVAGASRGLTVFAEGSGGFVVIGSLVGLATFVQYETARILPGDDGFWHVGGAAAPGSAGVVPAAVTAAIAAAVAASAATAAADVAALRANTQSAVVAGAAPGNITVTGMPAAAHLVAVVELIGAGVAVTDAASLTSEFTVSAAATINNTGGTDTTGAKLLVLWN